MAPRSTAPPFALLLSDGLIRSLCFFFCSISQDKRNPIGAFRFIIAIQDSKNIIQLYVTTPRHENDAAQTTYKTSRRTERKHRPAAGPNYNNSFAPGFVCVCTRSPSGSLLTIRFESKRFDCFRCLASITTRLDLHQYFSQRTNRFRLGVLFLFPDPFPDARAHISSSVTAHNYLNHNT